LTDILNPEVAPSSLPSLAPSGQWAIVVEDDLHNKLKVCVPSTHPSKDCAKAMGDLCATTRGIVCSIATLIDDLRDNGFIITNTPAKFGQDKIWIGTFDPTKRENTSPDLCLLDELQEEIKSRFIKNIYHSIDYISGALIELLNNNFLTKEEVVSKNASEAASKTATATNKLVWFTLLAPLIAVLVKFFLQKFF
jgi:hypothetical protein